MTERWSSGLFRYGCNSGVGKAFLLKSQTSPALAVSSWNFTAGQAGGGTSVVAGIGDVNKDGAADFAVGTPLFDQFGTLDNGRVDIFHGSLTGTPDTTADQTLGTTAATAQFGAALAGGDFDFDGFSDLLVGAPRWDGSFTDQGRVRVYGGGPSGIGTAIDVVQFGSCAACRLGQAVVGLNVNGDVGYADAAFSEPGASNGSANEGQVHVRIGEW